MAVRILYGDVAPEAKESFIPSTDNQALYENKLQDLRLNAQFLPYYNPCEKFSVLLDGNTMLLPQNVTTERLGLISTEVSGSDGSFTTPIELTLTNSPTATSQAYSSQGITFTFDTQNNIYPRTITIKWYNTLVDENEPIRTKTFNNVDNAFYFCVEQVSGYNKLVITFDNLNMPYNRLRLKVIDYGYGTYFEADELRNVNIIQQLNPLSSQIEINTNDFTLDSFRDIPYNFQAKQPLTTEHNGRLLCTTFIKKATRTSKRLWTIQSEDYISMLDGVNFLGGIYEIDTEHPETNTKAIDLIDAIFLTANIPYVIDTNYFDNFVVAGHIPICSCREALMQVLFAMKDVETDGDAIIYHIAVCDTSESDAVRIFEISNTIQQTIPLDRIRQGQNVVDDETITGVNVTSHAYIKNYGIEETELYKAVDNGIKPTDPSNNAYEVSPPVEVFVQFSNPCHYLEINNNDYGSFISSNANCATISISDIRFVLTGIEYDHTTTIKSKTNPLAVGGINKIAKFENATLISANNVDNVLEICYDYYINRVNMNLSIREGKAATQVDCVFDTARFDYDTFDKTTEYQDETPVSVGDKITAETTYLGNITGRIEKQAYTLIGNIIWKQCEVR